MPLDPTTQEDLDEVSRPSFWKRFNLIQGFRLLSKVPEYEFPLLG